jgi:hypothetical protein
MDVANQYPEFTAALRARRSAWLGSHQESDRCLSGLFGFSGKGRGKIGKLVCHGFQKVARIINRLLNRGSERDDECCVCCGKVRGRQGHSPLGDR